MPELSRRPYLLRAMHEWMVDCGYTPHLIVDALPEGVQVPREYVKEGRIVLNVSASATQALLIGPDLVEFSARFGGTSRHIRVPITAVLGIYARETGQGMVFNEEAARQPGSTEPATNGEDAAPRTPDPPKRAKLKVVK
ncbi:MAG: ClpXP protease specificity-enhancing factor [Pseudomonadota bacterium]